MFERTGRFARADRLRSSKDFERLSRGGRRARARDFIVLAGPRPPAGRGSSRRLGITVSRKVGSAVVRNRVKRLVREWFRAEGDALPPGTDLVVIARRGAAGLSAPEVRQELSELAGRVGGERP